jgi:hypothetical protein
MVQNGDLTSTIFTGNKTEFEWTKKNKDKTYPGELRFIGRPQNQQ